MGFWSRIFGGQAKDTSTNNPANWFLEWSGAEPTVAGVRVSPTTAMRQSAVWACVKVRSDDVAKLGCHLYERLDGGGKRRAVDHPLYDLLSTAPNPRMTAFEWFKMLQMHRDLRGNGYAFKEFDARGRLVALWPLPADRVTVLVTQDNREIFYDVTLPGFSGRFPSEAILHLRGESLDGLVGLSPISWHRETIGLAVAAQQYGSAFFGNSAQPRGALKVPTALSKEAAKALRADWESKYQGSDKAHRLAIFDGGMEWVATGMDNTDAQYIEIRKLQNEEIWRLYRMPAHKVGDLSRSTNNNIEQQALEYVQDCLLSELRNWEQTLKRDLLSEDERSRYFFEFNIDMLLRGDFKSRTDGYATAFMNGWMSPNDIREKENMNPIADGDLYFRPMNLVPLGSPAPPPKTPSQPSN